MSNKFISIIIHCYGVYNLFSLVLCHESRIKIKGEKGDNRKKKGREKKEEKKRKPEEEKV